MTLTLGAALPFAAFFHMVPFGELPSHWLATTAALLGAIATICLNGGRIRTSRFQVGLAGVLGALLAIAALGNSPSEDLRKLAIYALVVVCAAVWATTLAGNDLRAYYRKLAWIMLCSGIVQALAALALHYGVLAGIGRWMIPPGARMTGLPAQPNLLALYIFLAFAALCYLRLTGVVSLAFSLIAGAMFGMVIAGSGSRAALLYAALACCLLWSLRRTPLDRPPSRVLPLFAALIAGLPVYLLLEANLQPVMSAMGYIDRVATIDAQRDYSTVGFRPSEWRKAALMLLQHPWGGVGFGNYGVHSFWMGVEHPWAVTENSFPTHSHNLFAQIAAEFGIPGLAAVGTGILGLAVSLRRTPRNAEWWLVASACGAFAVNAMLEYALWSLHFAVLLALFLAPLVAHKGSLIRLRWRVVMAAAIALTSAWAVMTIAAADVYGKAMRYNTGVADQLEMFDLLTAADDSLLGREMGLLLVMNAPPSASSLDYQDPLTDRLMAWRPLSAVLFRRLQVAVLKGDQDEAAMLAVALSRFYPKHVEEVRQAILTGHVDLDASMRELLNESLSSS